MADLKAISVPAWQTSDGLVHTDKRVAERHQRVLNVQSALDQLSISWRCTNAKEVAEALVEYGYDIVEHVDIPERAK